MQSFAWGFLLVERATYSLPFMVLHGGCPDWPDLTVIRTEDLADGPRSGPMRLGAFATLVACDSNFVLSSAHAIGARSTDFDKRGERTAIRRKSKKIVQVGCGL